MDSKKNGKIEFFQFVKPKLDDWKDFLNFVNIQTIHQFALPLKQSSSHQLVNPLKQSNKKGKDKGFILFNL